MRWDQAKAAAVQNLGPTPITLELWDATNYNNVPPDCYAYSAVQEDGTGIPAKMIPLVFGLDRPRWAAQHGQLHLGRAAHAG